jgi:hypothetical protein
MGIKGHFCLTHTVIDMELDTDASVFGVPTSSVKRDLTEIWVEPIIGLRSGYEISNALFIHSRYDIGGFGAGSDFAWQAMANLAFKPKFLKLDTTVFAGYRAISQDYDTHDFEWDVTTHGPILGVAIRF